MADYELMMPFVLCKTNGGPFDDEAFTVGWDCGALEAELSTCSRLGATPRARYIKVAVLPQLDLIAMDTKFTLTLGEHSPEGEWVFVTFIALPNSCTCSESADE
jgi:hypothetical protein